MWARVRIPLLNEYLAIDSGGNVCDLVVARNCCMARMLPAEAELVSEWTGLSGRAKYVKRFEPSNGLDTALYKKNTFTFFTFNLFCPNHHSCQNGHSRVWFLIDSLFQSFHPCLVYYIFAREAIPSSRQHSLKWRVETEIAQVATSSMAMWYFTTWM